MASSKLNDYAARQPEIIRTVQKDLIYTNQLSEQFSDILHLSGPRNWIRYNRLCKIIAEIVYHGFASINNLQTLGEEYTGIIQIDSNYIKLPSKLLQLSSVIIEFGGDELFANILKKLQKEIKHNEDIEPNVKLKILQLISIMKSSAPYIKGFHKCLFYFTSSKFQIAKRLTGINYIRIRKWLLDSQSLHGYRILGIVTFINLTISLINFIRDSFKEKKLIKSVIEPRININDEKIPKCTLCLYSRTNTSLTPCGHLYCWDCILDWLSERDDCPICREKIKPSNIVLLQNYL